MWIYFQVWKSDITHFRLTHKTLLKCFLICLFEVFFSSSRKLWNVLSSLQFQWRPHTIPLKMEIYLKDSISRRLLYPHLPAPVICLSDLGSVGTYSLFGQQARCLNFWKSIFVQLKSYPYLKVFPVRHVNFHILGKVAPHPIKFWVLI